MSATTITLIVLVFALGLALGAGLIWFFLRRERGAKPAAVTPAPPKPVPAVRFRASYIVLPAAVALVAIVISLALYPSLPAQVAYRFTSGGLPTGYMARATFLVLMAGAQVLLVTAAYVIAASIVRVSRRMSQNQPLPVDPSRIIWLMANMVLLPQIILAFILVDSSIYAASNRHLMTPWLFSLIAIGVGTVVIAVLFVRSFQDYQK